MRALAAAVSMGLFALALGPRAAAAKEPSADLASGRYEVKLDGLLCHTCSKIVLEEVSALPQVQAASVDFDRGLLQVTIRSGQTLKIGRLRRALKRASRRADLDTQFTIQGVTYKVT